MAMEILQQTSLIHIVELWSSGGVVRGFKNNDRAESKTKEIDLRLKAGPGSGRCPCVACWVSTVWRNTFFILIKWSSLLGELGGFWFRRIDAGFVRAPPCKWWLWKLCSTRLWYIMRIFGQMGGLYVEKARQSSVTSKRMRFATDCRPWEWSLPLCCLRIRAVFAAGITNTLWSVRTCERAPVFIMIKWSSLLESWGPFGSDKLMLDLYVFPL